MEKYPVRNGIAIPVQELDLPESHLNLRNKENLNCHHLEYTARKFGQFVLFQVLRDIEVLHSILPIDIHSYIHNKYEAPNLPTPMQAMEFIEYSQYNEFKLHRRKNGHYIYSDITDEVIRRCKKSYDSLK